MRRKREKKTAMRLPYDMGNAGDFLKHGVLAEFVRWRCGPSKKGESFRFIDLFGGEPWERANPEVASRVRAFPEYVALRVAQTEIEKDRYYGSGLLVEKVAEQVGKGSVRVLVNDCCEEKRTRLKEAGLALLSESKEFSVSDADNYDAYKVFGEILPQLRENDLVLIDPFAEFLPKKAEKVIPQIKQATKQGAAVILFALNQNPCNKVGREFENLLKGKGKEQGHLPKAWRMTMPPLDDAGIRGESNYHAEVILAARVLEDEADSGNVADLRKRLEKLAEHLADILKIADTPARQLWPRPVKTT